MFFDKIMENLVTIIRVNKNFNVTGIFKKIQWNRYNNLFQRRVISHYQETFSGSRISQSYYMEFLRNIAATSVQHIDIVCLKKKKC